MTRLLGRFGPKGNVSASDNPPHIPIRPVRQPPGIAIGRRRNSRRHRTDGRPCEWELPPPETTFSSHTGSSRRSGGVSSLVAPGLAGSAACQRRSPGAQLECAPDPSREWGSQTSYESWGSAQRRAPGNGRTAAGDLQAMG